MTHKTKLSFLEEAKKTFLPFKAGVKRRANGALKYDYLVPSGYYKEQWDWDAFFMGIALSSDIPSEGIFLRNWALNYIHLANPNGYSPACVTPQGPETGTRAMLMKPFIAQGSFLASVFLDDFTWVKPHLSLLEKMVIYRKKHRWNEKYQLFVWKDSMESGADNNVAALNYLQNAIVATDVNTFMYKEFLALSNIFSNLGDKKKEKLYAHQAKTLAEKINTTLWDEEDKTYYNIDATTGNFIKKISYNCVHPLWAGIAPKEKAKAFIENYVLNPKKLYSKHGIRTLAKDDLQYSNINMIRPHSNWQGPVWPIANYFFVQALIRYGYQKEAITVAKHVAKNCLNDIKKNGGMHENYNAETGEPIAAPNFISWNLLVPVMLTEAHENTLFTGTL